METKTMADIEVLCGKTRENLELWQKVITEKGVDTNALSYGTAKEYSIEDVVVGIQNILTDVAVLVKNPDLFLKVSTLSERSGIIRDLNGLNSDLKSNSAMTTNVINNVVTNVDSLKIKLRAYNLWGDKDRLIEFEKEIDNVRKRGNDLLQDIRKVQSKVESSQGIYDDIVKTKEKYDSSFEELENKKKTLEEKVKSFETEYSNLAALAKRASENESAISGNLEKTNRAKEKFDEFVTKITEREKELKEQAKTTVEYKEALEKFTVDYEKNIADAEKLIDEAIKALNYKNAVGLSAAFETQLEEAKKNSKTVGWLIGAGVFVCITLGIGIWIVLGWGLGEASSHSTSQIIYSLVGRLSMFFLTITGAVFCARQYTKQKNIIEDYAYKTTVSKSIIAFSEELRDKDPAKYAEYISTVLKEIHQDPLRKRGDSDDETGTGNLVSLENLVSLIQAVNK